MTLLKLFLMLFWIGNNRNHRFLFKKIIVRKTTAITTTSKKTLSLPEIWIKIIKLFI